MSGLEFCRRLTVWGLVLDSIECKSSLMVELSRMWKKSLISGCVDKLVGIGVLGLIGVVGGFGSY